MAALPTLGSGIRRAQAPSARSSLGSLSTGSLLDAPGPSLFPPVNGNNSVPRNSSSSRSSAGANATTVEEAGGRGTPRAVPPATEHDADAPIAYADAVNEEDHVALQLEIARLREVGSCKGSNQTTKCFRKSGPSQKNVTTRFNHHLRMHSKELNFGAVVCTWLLHSSYHRWVHSQVLMLRGL